MKIDDRWCYSPTIAKGVSSHTFCATRRMLCIIFNELVGDASLPALKTRIEHCICPWSNRYV